MKVFGAAECSQGGKKNLIRQGPIVRTDHHIRLASDAVCCVESLMNGYHALVFATAAAHLARAPPTFSAGLPLLDTCICWCFGRSAEDYINKGRSESRIRGEDWIRASAF